MTENMTNESGRRKRTDVVSTSQTPKMKMIETLCGKFGGSFRRHFAELENIQVRKDGTNYESVEFTKELLKFLVNEFSHTAKGAQVLTQGQGEIPAEGESWLIHVGGSFVNLEHGREDVHIIFTHVAKGRATFSCVYFPLEERFYSAEYGNGAMAPNMRMRVSGREELENTIVGVFSPVSKDEDSQAFMKVVKNVRTLKMHMRISGSPVWDMIQVALGKADGFVGMNLSSHEVVTARLFLEEGGAKVTDLAGDEVNIHATTIVAGNSVYHNKLLGLV